jgi:hypothetical protein
LICISLVTMMSNIFSCDCWIFVYVLWRHIKPYAIFKSGSFRSFLSFYFWIILGGILYLCIHISIHVSNIFSFCRLTILVICFHI